MKAALDILSDAFVPRAPTSKAAIFARLFHIAKTKAERPLSDPEAAKHSLYDEI